jgi:peptidoglycan biosynthesis protein MviN/MurJ (putative lipid II flippase)
MGCVGNDAFKPDFFNNVAAVAIVLILAKVVAHRTKDDRGRGRSWRHVIAVVTAAVATIIALAATAVCRDWWLWQLSAGGFLLVAGVVFVGEIYFDDLEPHLGVVQRMKEKWRRRRGTSVTASGANKSADIPE